MCAIRRSRIAEGLDICRDIRHCSQEYRREAIAWLSAQGLLAISSAFVHIDPEGLRTVEFDWIDVQAQT